MEQCVDKKKQKDFTSLCPTLQSNAAVSIMAARAGET